MEQAHRHSLLILAMAVGEIACVRPVRWSIDTIAQKLPRRRRPGQTLRVGHVSNEWLRQHLVDFDKHGAGQ